jgi:hypothetical protein
MTPETLLQYGPLGILTFFSLTIIGALWKHIQSLNAQIYLVLGRYEALVTDMVKKEVQLENTLEKLQEGFTTKNLIEEYARKFGKDRK